MHARHHGAGYSNQGRHRPFKEAARPTLRQVLQKRTAAVLYASRRQHFARRVRASLAPCANRMLSVTPSWASGMAGCCRVVPSCLFECGWVKCCEETFPVRRKFLHFIFISSSFPARPPLWQSRLISKCVLSLLHAQTERVSQATSYRSDDPNVILQPAATGALLQLRDLGTENRTL